MPRRSERTIPWSLGTRFRRFEEGLFPALPPTSVVGCCILFWPMGWRVVRVQREGRRKSVTAQASLQPSSFFLRAPSPLPSFSLLLLFSFFFPVSIIASHCCHCCCCRRHKSHGQPPSPFFFFVESVIANYLCASSISLLVLLLLFLYSLPLDMVLAGTKADQEVLGTLKNS